MRPLLTSLLALHCAAALAAPATRVETLATRPGVTERFVFIKPDKPVASVVLFAGGNGNLQIAPDGDFGSGAGNFLVRTREAWARQGFQVAVVDAPSDRAAEGLGPFRVSPEHAEDTRAVIAFLRREAAVPVWLVGTSRGTTSAASIAIKLGPDRLVDGLVLTSTILDGPGNLPALNLQKIAVPVLVVHHRDDGCRHTPYARLPALMEKLSAAPDKSQLTVTGGRDEGDPCEARGHHGFRDVENEVIAPAAAWIKAHPAPN